MGGGSWTSATYTNYVNTHGYNTALDAHGNITISATHNAQDLYKSDHMVAALNPRGVLRECCDTEEHPATIPVILALDVTGSMGAASGEVQRKLNPIMADLYTQVKDVEFLTMGIGDLAYDDAPIQASQFESDIRIAEQLDKIYLEGGGGGNDYESYTAAWYFGLHNTSLDCWKRGARGIIITLGDEPLNPYLPARRLADVLGCSVQGDVDTKELYAQASEKFDIYHIVVEDRATSANMYRTGITNTWGKLLDATHLRYATLDSLAKIVTEIVVNAANSSPIATSSSAATVHYDENGAITW